MSEDHNKKPIVIKRVTKVVGGAHGGAWKIAYADFVTAMMAFFLLMWLLGSVGKSDLAGIAEYFKTPLQVALSGGSGSGNTTSIIKGGGHDITRSEGDVKKGAQPDDKKVLNPKTDQQEMLRMEREKEAGKLRDLKANIERAIESNSKLKQFKKQIQLDITSEGLRIQITDEQNRPMFQSGSAQLAPYTSEILHEIGRTLNEVPNKVSISGHTDAATFGMAGKGYSNWELSADRANASRRELINGGMAEGKIVRVVGLSSAVPFNKDDPLSPLNRRISLIVMNKQAEEAASHDGGIVGGAPEAEAQTRAAPAQPVGPATAPAAH